MASINISPASIEKHYRILDNIGLAGETKEGGYIRSAYSEKETSLMNYLARAADGVELVSRSDAMGNLIIETPGNYEEYVETGSHVDTVPYGGNYDGLAGVVAGLEALIALQRASSKLKKGLRLRVWRAEESASFGYASIGSRGAFGCLDPAALKAVCNGQTLEARMESCGADTDCIKKGLPALSAEERDSISVYVEMHIEQGSLLEAAGKDIGIVTGIRGAARYIVTLRGAFDHSGATPMGADYRKDANLALGYIMVDLDKLAEKMLGEGMDLVQTIGVINNKKYFNDSHGGIDKNAITKVSGFCSFTLEVRSCSEKMKEYCRTTKGIIEARAKKMGVRAYVEELSFTPCIGSLNKGIRERIKRSCIESEVSFLEMTSGAWHDSAVIAQQKRSNGTPIPAGLIFIPCCKGKSHSPEEYSSPSQIAAGATVLGKTLFKLSTDKVFD